MIGSALMIAAAAALASPHLLARRLGKALLFSASVATMAEAGDGNIGSFNISGPAVGGAVPCAIAAALLTSPRAAAAMALLGALFALTPAQPPDLLLGPFATPWSFLHILAGLLASAALLNAVCAAVDALSDTPEVPLASALLLTLALLLTGAGQVVGVTEPLSTPIQAADGGSGLVRVVRGLWTSDAAWLRLGALPPLLYALYRTLRDRVARAATAPLPTIYGYVAAAFLLAPFLALPWTATVDAGLGAELDSLERAVVGSPSSRLPSPPVLVAAAVASFLAIAAGRGRAAPTPVAAQRWADAALALTIAAALTGAMWSNYVWGALLVNDSRLFGATLTAALLGLASVARATWRPRTEHALVLLSGLAWLWMVVGPSLGWTSPTLHSF